MDAPFFSIIVAVYNVAPYLKACVRSILAQPGRRIDGRQRGSLRCVCKKGRTAGKRDP